MGKQEVMEGIGFSLVRALRERLDLNGSVVTGNLKRSISFTTDGNTIVIKMAGYGKNVEFGSSPHVIEPKNKKALAFKAGGDNVVVKRVNHPGSRAKPFVRPVIQQKMKKIVEDNIKRHGNA